MTKKATHEGECQLCGRRQKLPGDGAMAQHGYTVRWGFFSGVCPGSKHLPYELSADLLPARIEWAAAEVERLEAYAVETEKMTDHVWLSLYIKVGWNSRKGYEEKGYRDRKIPVARLVRESEHRFTYSDDELVRGPHEERHHDGLEALVREKNAAEAKAIRLTRDRVAEYLRWAKARLAAWVLAPEKLTAVVEEAPKPRRTCEGVHGCRRHKVEGFHSCWYHLTPSERDEARARRG